jgi:hypothetical protein
MSKVALADTLMEWELLVDAMEQSGVLDGKPYLVELREQLAMLLAAVKALSAEQSFHEGRRQALTQQLRITRGKGQELAINIRAVLKGTVGCRNEGLVRYRVRPIRSRSRKKGEAGGVAVYPRPDLLAAAGLSPQIPDEETSGPR